MPNSQMVMLTEFLPHILSSHKHHQGFKVNNKQSTFKHLLYNIYSNFKTFSFLFLKIQYIIFIQGPV